MRPVCPAVSKCPLNQEEQRSYSSNIANDEPTGCLLIFRCFFFFMSTSANSVSLFIVTSGSRAEMRNVKDY